MGQNRDPNDEGAVSGADVPEVVVSRLPLYLRSLTHVSRQGMEVISSRDLGVRLGMTPAQIRKDLSYFGRFGKQGRGYSVKHLLAEIRRILGLDREWSVVLVGTGRLGRAIMGYPGFAPEGFRIVAAFDSDNDQVGQVIGGLEILPTEWLPKVVDHKNIRIAIVAVPSDHTQEVVDLLVKSGVRAILNYAPYSPDVPPGVKVTNIDPVLALQAMTFYLTDHAPPQAHGRVTVTA